MAVKKQTAFFADLTYTNNVLSSDAFPFGAGLIAAYLKTHRTDAVDVEVFKYPEDMISRIVEANPDILGFTNYSWTLRISYHIAMLAKRRNPNIKIIFGGPNYDYDSNNITKFWHEYPDIDFYVIGEGEIAMVNLFDSLENYGFDASKLKDSSPLIGNCHYKNSFGQIVKGPDLPRMEIDSLPSPYTMGLMDKFFDNRLLPLTHTTRGCPFRCTFCAEGSDYYRKVKQRHNLSDELEYIAKHVGDNISEILFSDANFGMFKDDIEKAKIIRDIQEKYNYPRFIHVSTGKNKKERVLEVSSIINDALRGIGAALQSTDEEVLENVKRSNISLEDLSELSVNASTHDANSFTELILGLPGDTKEKHFKTLKDVIEADIGIIRMYQAIMLPQTELFSDESRKKYGIETAWRIMPRAFGRFQFEDTSFVSVECEEIIVATNTMSFEEYLECREMNLFIEIFHNGAPFAEVRSLVRGLGGEWFDFLQLAFDRRHNYPVLNAIFNEFKEASIEKYWPSKESLLTFVDESIEKLLNDTRGSNEMARAKSTAFFRNMKEMHHLMYDALTDFVMDKQSSADLLDYVNDLKRFSFLRKVYLQNTNKEFSYISSWQFDIDDTDFSQPQKCERPIEYSIYHNKEQKDLLDDHINFQGKTIDGLSRMIMFRVNYDKIFRSFSI